MNKRDKKKKEKANWQREKQLRTIHKRLPLEVVKSNIVERECNECQSCCQVIGVKELDKPIFIKCVNQCETGCNIYENRPEACKQYYCLYLIGALKGDKSNRPDNLGMIFDLRPEGPIDTIGAWEVFEDALEQPKVKELIKNLLLQTGGKVPVIVRRYNSKKLTIYGKEELVKQIQVIIKGN
jgi:hypothetical protein